MVVVGEGVGAIAREGIMCQMVWNISRCWIEMHCDVDVEDNIDGC